MRKHSTQKLSRVSTLHYVKLVFRAALFLAAAVIYLTRRIQNVQVYLAGYDRLPLILVLIWLVFVVEMIFRFFPSRVESMGCQKQFARNYKSTGKNTPVLQASQTTFLVAAAWIALNAGIAALYFTNVIDEGILLLICLAYSVCDMICILFFCPFQTWFMKNKCCTSCRIYNWDYAMMFTPLILVKSYYTWSLLGIALILLLKWEILARVHPERFSETTNQNLSCACCQEKLCHHKRQLRTFLSRNAHELHLKGNALISKAGTLRRKDLKQKKRDS